MMHTDWERFRDAVVVLAGSGPLKQRLAEACLKHLGGIEIDALPRDVRGVFAELNAALQSGSRTGRFSPVAACVLKMSEAEAARHAESIVTIFAGLHEQHPARRQTVQPPCCAPCRATTTTCRRSSIELELDRVPARRLFVTRLAPDRIHQFPLVPGHHLVRHLRSFGRRNGSFVPNGSSTTTGLSQALA